MINKYSKIDFTNILNFTFDCDWAPEFILEELIILLKKNNIKATFFATNPSEILNFYEEEGIIELGIHPNFFKNSSHGKEVREVFLKLLEWFPNSVGMRSHGLYQSSAILKIANEFGIKYDSNLMLYNFDNLYPFESTTGLIRIPFNWADATILNKDSKTKFNKDFLNFKFLKVLDFHPILWYLNLNNLQLYDELKSKSIKPLNLLDENHYKTFIQQKEFGLKDYFNELIDYVKIKKVNTAFLKDLI